MNSKGVLKMKILKMKSLKIQGGISPALSVTELTAAFTGFHVEIAA